MTTTTQEQVFAAMPFNEPVTVSALSELAQLEVPVIRHHLNALSAAGVVKKTKGPKPEKGPALYEYTSLQMRMSV